MVVKYAHTASDVKVQDLTEGQAMADVAVAERLQYIISSTLQISARYLVASTSKSLALTSKRRSKYVSLRYLSEAFSLRRATSCRIFQKKIVAPRLLGSGAYKVARPVFSHS